MKLTRAVDQDPSLPDWVIPDFLYEELEKESESGVIFSTRRRIKPSTN